MKRIFLYFSLVMVPVLFSMAPGGFPKVKSYNLFKETVPISDELRISKVEVSNNEYKHFLMGLIEENRADLVPQYAPDPTCWNRTLLRSGVINDPYVKYYFGHPAFKDYPVVGISYEAAQAYCEWKTRTHGEMPITKKSKEMAQYQFRLPTEEEWMVAAEVGSPNRAYWSGGFDYPRSARGQYLFNHKLGKGNFAGIAGGKAKDFEGYMITAPVKTFHAKKTGLYNMTGNVAEMVSPKGKVKGGSWADLADACVIEAEQPYQGASADTGFRFAVERK